MRFIVNFTVILLLLGVSILGLWYGLVEGTLWFAAYQLKQDVSFIQHTAMKMNYTGNCQVLNKTDRPEVSGYQLRFIDDKNYVMEVACGYGQTNYQVIKKGSLKGGVKRIYGSGVLFKLPFKDEINAGILIGQQQHYVELIVNRRKLDLSWANKENWGNMGNDYAVSMCTMAGMVCCDDEVGEGQGGYADKVTDCPMACYQKCKQRPQVINFNSSPFMNAQNRQLLLSSTETHVEFSMSFQDIDGSISRAWIDFGDGKTEEIDLNEEVVAHDYVCTNAPCWYKATAMASDNEGLISKVGRLSTIEILIQ